MPSSPGDTLARKQKHRVTAAVSFCHATTNCWKFCPNQGHIHKQFKWNTTSWTIAMNFFGCLFLQKKHSKSLSCPHHARCLECWSCSICGRGWKLFALRLHWGSNGWWQGGRHISKASFQTSQPSRRLFPEKRAPQGNPFLKKIRGWMKSWN